MPERLGSAYVLETKIGYGGMGEVWAGVGPDGPVAIKLLRAELADDPDVVMRFVRERTILRSLASPHIVEVRDLVVEGDRLAIVMELVRGSDLRHRLRDEATMLPRQAADLVAQVLEGLAVAHAADVVHRDLKPENILVVDGPGGLTAKVVDFGVARIAAASRTSHTTGLIGTPKYLAPELGSGGRATPASDVYSAGVVWYELLFGRVPFDGEIPLAVLRAHADEAPVRPPKVPDALWQELEAMLAKDPAARPAAAEAAARLHALVPTLTGRVRFRVLPNRAESDGPTIVDASGAPPAAAGPLSGRRRAPSMVIVSALATTALVAAAAGGVIALAGGDDTATVCDPGVRWQQAPRPLPDGTRVKTVTRNGTDVHGSIHGGALLGIPDAAEAEALGLVAATALSREDYDALDRRPRDGMLMRERVAPDGGPGRVFYSVGGATFEVSDEQSLRAIGLDGRDAVVIPRQGLDHAPRSPRTGTLLRLAGSERVWVIDGGTRKLADHVCSGARVNDLPPSDGILAAIPVARTTAASSTSRPATAEPDPGDDLVAEACERAPGGQPMAVARGTVTNHTRAGADYLITIRLLTESGDQLGEAESVAATKVAAGEARRWEHRFAVKPDDLPAIDRCEYFVTRTPVP